MSAAQPPQTDLLRAIASSPRPTGSDAIAAARARVTRELVAIGFTPREVPFEFSALPGKFATPLFAIAGVLVVAVAGHLGADGSRYGPILVTVLGGVVLGVSGWWVARHGVLALPLLRRQGVNVEFTRPHAQPPEIWLCAHLDTKSQPLPTLARVVGIAIAGLGVIATLGLSVLAASGMAPGVTAWAATTLVTLAGTIPVVLSVTGDRSPGALDNASGVATVVEAARALEGRDIAVLVTDAEELGLAGARAWAKHAKPRADAILLNCDGVDDSGDVVVMYTSRPPRAVLDGVARGARTTGIAFRAQRMTLGILTDTVAFTDAGLASVTFSRGTMRSLARVHSRRDDLRHLRGDGIADAAALIAATARHLVTKRTD